VDELTDYQIDFTQQQIVKDKSRSNSKVTSFRKRKFKEIQVDLSDVEKSIDFGQAIENRSEVIRESQARKRVLRTPHVSSEDAKILFDDHNKAVSTGLNQSNNCTEID
jgi:hypothetical protein